MSTGFPLSSTIDRDRPSCHRYANYDGQLLTTYSYLVAPFMECHWGHQRIGFNGCHRIYSPITISALSFPAYAGIETRPALSVSLYLSRVSSVSNVMQPDLQSVTNYPLALWPLPLRVIFKEHLLPFGVAPGHEPG